ncbi:MAG: SelT/SelW/SelH family protein [Veillonellaceae bacterium]|nr:SelT/SelW/SelH family protein [Veillonellaceae bacterium]
MAADLLQAYEPEIKAITLVPSDGGRFEVMVNGKLVYSKLKTVRHAEEGEVLKLVKEQLRK